MKYLKLFSSRRLSGDLLSGAESSVGAYSRLMGRMRLRSYSVDAAKLGNSDAVALDRSTRQQAESSAFGPEKWVKLASDPGAGELLNQPDFLKMMQDIEKNPNTFNLYLKDQRVTQALGALSKFQGRRDMEMASGGSSERKMPLEGEHVTAERRLLPDPGPGPMEISLEMGWYEDCIIDCDIAVQRGGELKSDVKLVARALIRKGSALVNIVQCSKDYEPAIETFYRALTEHRNPYTLKKLNDVEKDMKDLEQQEYFDPKLADEEREKGNQFFNEQKYPEAIKHYTKALNSNPKDRKAYTNRAASYTKLGAMPEGLKDAEKCIELDPTFAKGYTRKGAIQFFMKKFDNALETYHEGLKHDPSNQELLDGIRRCVEQINKASQGDFSPDELKERQANVMQDPEIQNILTDPELIEVSGELKKKERKPMAQKVIEAGNAAYKKMDFETAIEHNLKAIKFALYLEIVKHEDSILAAALDTIQGPSKFVLRAVSSRLATLMPLMPLEPVIVLTDATWSQRFQIWIVTAVAEVAGQKFLGFLQAVKLPTYMNMDMSTFQAELKGFVNGFKVGAEVSYVSSRAEFYNDNQSMVYGVKGLPIRPEFLVFQSEVNDAILVLNDTATRYRNGVSVGWIPRDVNEFADAFGKFVRYALEFKDRVHPTKAHLDFLQNGVYYDSEQMDQIRDRMEKAKKDGKK